MSFQLQYLVLLALILAIAILVYYLQRQEGKVKENLHALAQEHGWSLEMHPTESRAYLLKGQQDEVAWEVELYRAGRRQSALTIWKTSDASILDGPLLVGAALDGLALSSEATGGSDAAPRPGWELLSKTPGMGVYPLPYPLGLTELNINPADLIPQEVGNPVFQERYNILGCSASGADRILNPGIQETLLGWPQVESIIDLPVIIADQTGLSVRLNQDKPAEQPELLERLVNLGLDLARAVLADAVEVDEMSERITQEPSSANSKGQYRE